MTKHNLLWPGAALAGAAAWLAKLGVIIATDGATTSTGAAAVFFVAGAALLALGAIGLMVHLTAGRPGWQRAGAGLLGVPLFLVSFIVLEAAGKALVGDAGPSYLPGEVGILATALFWLLAASRQRIINKGVLASRA